MSNVGPARCLARASVSIDQLVNCIADDSDLFEARNPQKRKWDFHVFKGRLYNIARFSSLPLVSVHTSPSGLVTFAASILAKTNSDHVNKV